VSPKVTEYAAAGSVVHEHRLQNGLRVLIVERHLDPVVAVTLWYRVGARDEREHEAGVSHFLEHMMFKGSRRFGKGEVDRVTASLGGTNNAYTSYDHTAYWFEFASDRWERALDLEADRMRGLRLDPDEFDAERAVVLEELGMGEDDPWRNLSREVGGVLFGRHPYGRPIIGYRDTLAAMTPESMRAYHRRFYRPGNATLVVCGDVTPRAALRAVRERFGKIADRDADAPAWRPPLAFPDGPRRLTTRWDDPAARLLLAWPGAVVGSDDDFALDLVSSLLTGGRLSRLHRRLVLDEGLATYVSASNDARVEGGAFWLFAEAARGVAPERLEAALHEELARLATDLVPAAELKRVRQSLEASEAYDSETVTDLGDHVGQYAVDDRWDLVLEFAARRKAVTARKVREAAARILDPERAVVGWSLPNEAKGGGA
jgi:zinc protease